ncbi:mitoguardin 1-like [Ornithorhynchus anatinus]|uniref:mitoguardin 1-like n=1 Tax=Ornithorhynchus anatinus TaxID=9258 RepID=UPI0010A7B907|nr:mitoguardin 1-like [Ornithorhynchus anatinus]
MECFSPEDRLEKLHFLWEAFELLLMKESTRSYLIESGRDLLQKLIVLDEQPSLWDSASLSPTTTINDNTLQRVVVALSGQPSNFIEAYDNLISFVQQPSNWDTLTKELHEAGVANINFYDVVFGFIAFKLFREAEEVPEKLRRIIGSDQISRPLKKMTVLVYCWSQSRKKRLSWVEQSGFLYYLY